MSTLLATLSIATLSVAVIVIIGGVISGLVALGVIELFFRTPFQKRIVQQNDDFPVKRYLQMEPETFYSLHQRQLCGVLVAKLAADAARFRDEFRDEDTQQSKSALETLAYWLLKRAGTIPPVDPPSPYEYRAIIEHATATVDSMQARISIALRTYAFRYAFVAWLILFLLSAVAIGFSFRGIIASALEITTFLVLLAPACIILAFASAVVGALVYGWLDRAFSVK